MKRLLRFILLFALVCSICGATNDSFLEQSMKASESTLTSDADGMQSFTQSSVPHLPFAELGSIGLNSTYATDSRIHRIHLSSYATALRDISRNISSRQELLSQQREKLSNTSFLSGGPACKYYVFALRHILI